MAPRRATYPYGEAVLARGRGGALRLPCIERAALFRAAPAAARRPAIAKTTAKTAPGAALAAAAALHVARRSPSAAAARPSADARRARTDTPAASAYGRACDLLKSARGRRTSGAAAAHTRHPISTSRRPPPRRRRGSSRRPRARAAVRVVVGCGTRRSPSTASPSTRTRLATAARARDAASPRPPCARALVVVGGQRSPRRPPRPGVRSTIPRRRWSARPAESARRAAARRDRQRIVARRGRACRAPSAALAGGASLGGARRSRRARPAEARRPPSASGGRRSRRGRPRAVVLQLAGADSSWRSRSASRVQQTRRLTLHALQLPLEAQRVEMAAARFAGVSATLVLRGGVQSEVDEGGVGAPIDSAPTMLGATRLGELGGVARLRRLGERLRLLELLSQACGSAAALPLGLRGGRAGRGGPPTRAEDRVRQHAWR